MEIQHSVSLQKYTTFQTGGFARLFCVVHTVQELQEAVRYAKQNNEPWYILGGGSNVLVSSAGFDGLVIQMSIQGIRIEKKENMAHVHVGAGMLWDELVAHTVEQGLYGLENLSLIPGTVGASPVQNIGAYGAEVKDTIHTVTVYDTHTDEVRILTNEECAFGYRDSIFKKDTYKHYVVTEVCFTLQEHGVLKTSYKDIEQYFERTKEEITLQSLRLAIMHIRTEKLPSLVQYGTAGSFFKNPLIERAHALVLQKKYTQLPLYEVGSPDYVKVSAAFLIDVCAGMKGVRVGNVGTYSKQALVLVNYGGATGEEVYAFSEAVIQKVHEVTSVTLEREVQMLGF